MQLHRLFCIVCLTTVLLSKQPRALALIQKITELEEPHRGVMSSLAEELMTLYGEEEEKNEAVDKEEADEKNQNNQSLKPPITISKPINLSKLQDQELLERMDQSESKILKLNEANEQKQKKIIQLEAHNAELQDQLDSLRHNLQKLNLQNQDFKSRVSFF